MSLFSRYNGVESYLDGDCRVLEEYVPYRYREREDTILHTVGEGDSWATVAQAYFGPISDRACGLWWVLCDFQPTPVVDPTIQPQPGRVVHVPSPAVVQTEILSRLRVVFA